MIDNIQYWNYLARCASALKQVEHRLTNEQIIYLNQYYTVKKTPSVSEIQLICAKFNMKGIWWLVDIEYWFCGRRLAEEEIQQRRRLAKKAAA
ncbi:unnamed protein product [Adineta ricciae]|uniref:Homeobox domain-containing protein n=1 Tax=Adineta ricciae TaxID=249248 RepID=A0A814C6R6_ADIRI|nr:unnamed protein product [Adineta ricciae]